MRTPCSVGGNLKTQRKGHRGHTVSPSGTILQKEYELERAVIKEAIDVVMGSQCDTVWIEGLDYAVRRYVKFVGRK